LAALVSPEAHKTIMKSRCITAAAFYF